ncbi:MAG: aminoglycoside phosphotransferase [Burkholderiales bacterium]|nr:MAG: aminoglycoside phosphotransferase [Burkholderiales bacterium]
MGPSMSIELVQALQRQLHAQLIETHISWVLLDGTHAWKIKKPVTLSFLDFSSLTTRHRLCHEELALNRRLAPSLYLDVSPISGTAEAPELGGTGEPIEYALRMKQFDAGALFSERLAHGQLMPDHLVQLAEKLAAFHAQAPQAGQADDWGSPARITRPVETLMQGLQAHGCEAACAALQPWLQQQAQVLHAIWLQRRQDGWVIEGHGDLHLANAVLLPEGATAFDCIEFDPALRWVDGLSDIAFMAMDLMAHGHDDLAWCFLNAYLDVRGDHAGLPVLRYYLVYRALVRALVARLRADQGGADRRPDYLALALRLSAPAPARLLITHGVSGSGKTHVSRLLAREAGAVHLRADVIRKRLFGLSPTVVSHEVVPGGIYTAEANAATYARLLDLSRLTLQWGWPVIVDATFLDAADRHRFAELAHCLSVPFTILHCQAPGAVLRARIAQRQARGGDASEATQEVLSAQQVRAQPLSSQELPHTLTLDASRPWPAGELAAQWRAMAG